MPLSDSECRAAAPKPQPYKMTDGAGLYLHVSPAGTKTWRMAYTFDGHRRDDHFGQYPKTSLAAARRKRDQWRAHLADGANPRDPAGVVCPREDRFRAVAEAWMQTQEHWRERHRNTVGDRLRQDAFPAIGDKPIRSITGADVLALIRAIEDRDALHSATKVRSYLKAIFAFAIAEGRAVSNPAVEIAPATRRPRHHKMLTDIPEFMRRLHDYDGERMTAIALEVTLRTALRTSEIRAATRAEIETEVWRKPAAHMKRGVEHLVPMVPQVRALLNEAIRLGGTSTDLIFPGDLDPRRPMSENTMLFAMYRMGYRGRATVHGMRRNFSTAANESGRFDPEHIEVQLSHVDDDKIRSAYNAALYLPFRRRLMEWWNARIDEAALADLL